MILSLFRRRIKYSLDTPEGNSSGEMLEKELPDRLKALKVVHGRYYKKGSKDLHVYVFKSGATLIIKR